MRRYPFTPQVLDALPEELAELFRGARADAAGGDRLPPQDRWTAERGDGAGYTGPARLGR